MYSGIWSLLALFEPLIDYWISSAISLLLCFPPEEFAMDYLMNPDPEDAANYSLIDSLIAPLSWEYFSNYSSPY